MIKCIKNIVAGFIVSFLLLIYGCFSFINFDIINYKIQTISIVNHNRDTILKNIEENDIKSLYKIKGIKEINVQKESEYINFLCFGYGIGSGTVYYGFYYSYDNKVHNVFSDKIELISDGIGYSYKQLDGDNTYYTEKITNNLYYYEAHF